MPLLGPPGLGRSIELPRRRRGQPDPLTVVLAFVASLRLRASQRTAALDAAREFRIDQGARAPGGRPAAPHDPADTPGPIGHQRPAGELPPYARLPYPVTALGGCEIAQFAPDR